MIYNVTEYLERNARLMPEKIAVSDRSGSYTWRELRDRARRIATSLLSEGTERGIMVYGDKSFDVLSVFLGAAYAGLYYSLMSTELPASRLRQSAEVLGAGTVIADSEHFDAAREIFEGRRIIASNELCEREADDKLLAAAAARHIDTDPLYINFTSGSTGTPKGIAVCHRSVVDFIECFTDIFGITSDDVIANQAPFDFDVSVKDIYSSLKTGAELSIVPRELFSQPAALLDWLCDHGTTTMIWAVSALCLISTFHGLDYKVPEKVNKILFSGEVLPYKHFKTWKTHLPEAVFVNLYGPTEITCNCTYHILDAERDYSDGIPIGKPFPNEHVFLLDDADSLVRPDMIDTVGEICVRGTALALGYYNNPAQCEKHFVQNPLNSAYPETIYRTGDLARYNEDGDLVFSGRKDFQIKYMGHRIELEEIERAMNAIEGVVRSCCVFDEKRSRLKGFYVGTIDKDELFDTMRSTLPAFMVPGLIRKVDEMPLTKNGKTDRKRLDEEWGGRR